MLWELLEWLQLTNQNVPSLVAINQNVNDLILLMYLVSIKRSLHFAVAFLACDVATSVNYFGVFNDLNIYQYEVNFYLGMCLIWCLLIGCKITPNMNKRLAVWCSIMILLMIAMAIDGGFYAHTETYLHNSYKALVVCVHGGIILSFYRPSAFIHLLVGNIRRIRNWGAGSYSLQFIWYTAYNYKATVAQRWLTLMRQL